MYVKPAPSRMCGLQLARVLSRREAYGLLRTIRGAKITPKVRRSKVLERPDGYAVVAAEVDGSIVVVWLRGNVRNLFIADVLRAEEWRA